MMDILPVDEDDLHPLCDLLKRNLIFENITEELTKEKIFGGPDFEPENSLKAVINSQIVGFTQGVTREYNEKKIGFIKLFATDEKWRKRGIASNFLRTTEEKLWSEDVKEIRILESNPNYPQPGLDPRYTDAFVFITKRGYEKFDEVVNLKVNLEGQNFSTGREEEVLSKRGIEIKRTSFEDKPAVLAFIARNFALWRGEVGIGFGNKPISIHIGVKDGRVVAFAAYDTNNSNTGWFGPMGTLKEFRGMGIGNVLLKRCLEDMRLQGHKVSTIPWVGPIAFYYDSVGASIERVFWRFRKTSPNGVNPWS